ncbi:MAG: lipoate--protein ligase family protein [Candidatus Micrarchaeia archaeon]
MGNLEALYFGYDTEEAATNMAVDEVLEGIAAATGHTFLRFYDTPRNAIVLSISDHPSVIKGSDEKIEISRRITGGKPIFLGSNTLSYSIEGSIDLIAGESKGSMLSNPNILHNVLGTHILEALKKVTGLGSDRMALGDVYSVTVDGKPIVGHAQHLSAKSFIYHGVIAIDKWDAEFIKQRLVLREGDFERISSLPYVKEFSSLDTQTLKRMIIEEMIKTFDLKSINAKEKNVVMERAKELRANVYANSKWVLRSDEGLKKNATFCFLYSG